MPPISAADTAWTLLPDVANVWTFLVLGSLAAMLFSLAKTGFGGSVGMLAVPMMIYACDGDATMAVGIMLPLLIAADWAAVIAWGGRWDLKAAGMLLPGAVVGIAIGGGAVYALQQWEQAVDTPPAATARTFPAPSTARAAGTDDDAPGDQSSDASSRRDVTGAGMRLGIGLIALGFVALQLYRYLTGRMPAFRPRWPQATGAGCLAGFTSTLAHAAGPVVAMYLLSQRMEKSRYVATTAVTFWAVNQMKLVPYFSLGLINTDTLGAGVVLIPGIAVGAVLGYVLHRRVGPKQFAGVVYVLLALAGVHLTYQGLAGLI